MIIGTVKHCLLNLIHKAPYLELFFVKEVNQRILKRQQNSQAENGKQGGEIKGTIQSFV